MYFEQFFLGCLAHASYMLGSSGEAIVVDPQRDVDLYLKVAEEHGLKIRHVRTFRAGLDVGRGIVADELENLAVGRVVHDIHLAGLILDVQAAEHAGAVTGIAVPKNGRHRRVAPE